MIGEFGEVLVIDWGMAEVLDRAIGSSKQTNGTMHRGARRHARWNGPRHAGLHGAPNRLGARSNNWTRRADVYALGVSTLLLAYWEAACG